MHRGNTGPRDERRGEKVRPLADILLHNLIREADHARLREGRQPKFGRAPRVIPASPRPLSNLHARCRASGALVKEAITLKQHSLFEFSRTWLSAVVSGLPT